MKAEYKNSIRSREMIRQALIRLLKKRSISEISVTDIVREANINRGTFYNHYGNPVDVLYEMKDELTNTLTAALKLVSDNNPEEFLNTLYSHFSKNEKTYRTIVNSIPMSVIDDMKKNLIDQLTRLLPDLDMVSISMIVNAMAGAYIDYLKYDMGFSFDDIVQKSRLLLRFIMSRRKN